MMMVRAFLKMKGTHENTKRIVIHFHKGLDRFFNNYYLLKKSNSLILKALNKQIFRNQIVSINLRCPQNAVQVPPNPHSPPFSTNHHRSLFQCLHQPFLHGG